MRAILPLLLAIGCGPATATIGETDLGEPLDPGRPDEGDPTDSGDPGDPGDPGTPDPLDLSVWEGSRAFVVTFSNGVTCEDEVEESGEDVSGDSHYAGAVEACPACVAIYEITVSPDAICGGDNFQGIPVGTPIVRGLELSEHGEAVVWAIAYDNWRGWRAEPLGRGSFDGPELTYAYDGETWGADYEVEGLVEFEGS